MIWKTKFSRITECLCRRPGLVLVSLPCLLILTLYFVINDEDFDDFQYPSFRSYNSGDDAVNGYLVWNPKCHILSKNPLDPSIAKFVKTEKFESCSNEPPMTRISRESNGSIFLVMEDTKKQVTCCWASIVRPEPSKPPKDNFDSTITVKHCEDFGKRAAIPRDVDTILVTCRNPDKGKKSKAVYENVHAILNPEKVRDRFELNDTSSLLHNRQNVSRKLSVLILGIDSVSRLNFQRTMPMTNKFLSENGWTMLNGYNKMGENTFPNLMAILTGQNQEQSYSRCKPTVPYMLDQCPFIWYNFRNAGYVTAYGEDETTLNTFDYLKVGFVESPTDYYLRPYMLASEKLLKVKKRFRGKYCTGPTLSFDRILDYAMNFAHTFMGVPYFGFFWTNTISHDNMNGPSSMDKRILKRFEYMSETGILNDTMVIFLSDHGMRYGSIRNTFVGWYEERLPFLYVWLPPWYREESPDAYQALWINKNRLTSPFDVYETFRDILLTSGGNASLSSGCPTCQSIFYPVSKERGCRQAGIKPHWCTCSTFEPGDTDNKIILEGTRRFLDHVESIVKNYKNKKGKRLCAKLRLKKIHRASRVIEPDRNNSTSGVGYFFMIQVAPGDGRFEVTVRYHANGTYTVSDEEVSRINSYASSAKCLDHGSKHYCQCIKS